MRLVVAEKPSVAAALAAALGVKNKKDGYMDGGGYLISWCVGHLVELAQAAAYGEQYKKWSYDSLPILPQPWQYTVFKDRQKQFKILKDLMRRSDVSEVVNACDAGREGELIFRLVYHAAGCDKPFSRLWISSMEKSAIKRGFAELKPGKDYDALYASALCRAKADWIIGINATRLFSVLHGKTLNVGRVQTPTLKMLADRDAVITSFKKETYHIVRLDVGGAEAASARISDAAKAEALKTACEASQAVCTSVVREKKTAAPPKLFDLTSLQREANRIFGYTAKQTLDLAQALYEKKLLTYPRTDSTYLTDDMGETAANTATMLCGKLAFMEGAEFSPDVSRVLDSKQVSDHHAIIPTEQYVQLSALSNEERRIYDLVVRRFLAVLLPPCVYEETVIQASIEKECFTARGKRMVEKGWQEAYEDNRYDEEDEAKEEVREQNLPLLEAGMKIGQPKISLREGKTKPPARFTEGTLLSAMENPVRYMENRDSSLVKTIGEAGGLGTVATRADIIEKLFRSFLLEKKGNEIYLTSKARQLLKLVPADLKKPELTASWEMQLNDIAKGKKRRDVFMKEIRSYTVELIDEIKTEEGTFRHDNLTNKKCPNCGKRLLAVNGKNAKLLVCQDRECGYRETVSRTTNARCPVCHKRMEMIGKGEDATFVCACGHKERMTKFQERRKKEGGGVTKRDVAAYMKKQKKEAEEPVNNAFAAALKGIKL